ncbi:MAG: M20/M25/M40 family metallo-hydrolase [Candidatus Saccharimonas sp.]|nr:M20/M25/M40 family metallo-hydrolase [Planctomycetaceae bacterium]
MIRAADNSKTATASITLCLLSVAIWSSNGLAADILIGNEADPVAKAIERVMIADLKRHCATLASDALEGREAGANGGKAACAYLQSELRKVSGISPAGTSGWLQEFAPDYRNVLAVLPGSDPELSREVIVIGAHYDHVGRGNQTNSYGPFGHIHNGADDNASGTAALLELIDAFTSLVPAPRRTLLFAFWDAEEVGLLGSKHWVRHPTRPLTDLRLVLNVDMLGRLREGRLTVMGWRSAAGLRARLTAVNPLGDLHYLFTPTVIADSDHYPFYEAGIPSIHFDSGKHEDYHRPSDDADKLNYPGIQRLSEMVFRLALTAANEPTLPKFRREALTEPPPSWMSAKAAEPPPLRLGVAFDPQESRNGVALVTQVAPGSPAQRAGIRLGDRFDRLAHWSGGQVDDLRTIIQTAKSPLAIRLQRPGHTDPIDLNVELRGEPVRLGIAWQTDAALPDSLVIVRVVPDSPADRAGLKIGDVLMSYAGRAITSDEEFRLRLLSDPGPLSLPIERNGRPLDVSVELYEPKTPLP